MNISELAKVAGASTRSLRRWKSEPGFPKPDRQGRYNVEACLAWMDDQAKAASKGASMAKRKVSLEAQRIELQIARLKFELDLRREKYLPVVEVLAETTRMVRAFKLTLQTLPRKAAATCAGRPPAEIEKVLDGMVNDVCRALHEDPWPDQKTADHVPIG